VIVDLQALAKGSTCQALKRPRSQRFLRPQRELCRALAGRPTFQESLAGWAEDSFPALHKIW